MRKLLPTLLLLTILPWIAGDCKPMGKLTAFSYFKSGGFAGMHQGYRPNLAKLSPKDKAKLDELIAKSGLLKSKGDKKITAAARDMFEYEFGATANGVTHKAQFDDGTLPASYRPLVKYLEDKLVDQPRQ